MSVDGQGTVLTDDLCLSSARRSRDRRVLVSEGSSMGGG